MHMQELPVLILIQRLSPPFGVSPRDSKPLDGKELSYGGNEPTTNAEPDTPNSLSSFHSTKLPVERASGGKELSYGGNETTTNAEPDTTNSLSSFHSTKLPVDT
ncbi:hypothetical protein DAPPUDRAFT_261101 [Daphnia pulex]|uniref:Uncharacterized protein n=1 Tax=Daphnia pulex TaxID=6669 RepID=E9HKJ3_DAPPU|nr:hypothetical protein DAPPUDRAFT_261101 [Daphnia pulex]|eukprot:EFX67749.1 hypothetical protein DAPPUDRAFT_261101 [Daphnia pulex]